MSLAACLTVCMYAWADVGTANLNFRRRLAVQINSRDRDGSVGETLTATIGVPYPQHAGGYPTSTESIDAKHLWTPVIRHETRETCLSCTLRQTTHIVASRAAACIAVHWVLTGMRDCSTFSGHSRECHHRSIMLLPDGIIERHPSSASDEHQAQPCHCWPSASA